MTSTWIPPLARPARLAGLLLAVATLVSPGCSDDGGTGGDPADVIDDVDATEPERSYLVAGRAEGYDIEKSSPRVFSIDALGDLERVEALVVPLDLLGVPWSEFLGPNNAPGELPSVWFKAVQDMRDAAQETGRPLILALSPLNGTFDNLAAEAIEEAGALVLKPNWTPGSQNYCFNPSKQSDPLKYRDAYAGYARWMVQQFTPPGPAFVIVGQRINLYEENCNFEAGAYESVASFTWAAHARIKELDDAPTTIVSVDVEDLYGFPKQPGRCQTGTPQDCFEERKVLLEALSGADGEAPPDRLGLESYPAVALPEVGTLPSDWLSRVIDARSDMAPVIAGTAVPATDIRTELGVCQDLLLASDVEQRSWLDSVLALAGTEEMELVVWHPLRDLLSADVLGSCPCSGDPALCQHLGFLTSELANAVRLSASAGLWAADDSERLAGTLWSELLGLDEEADAQ